MTSTKLINPTGRFVIGSSKADCGVTGRKLACDTYGGIGRIGGGALSGKDPSKVDRSAAYIARKITTDPAVLNFGTVNQDDKGSYTQPATQTVKVENKGNSAVTLTKPDSTSYTIGELSKATLGAGESATFTVQPKGDLTAGTHSETLEVTTDKGIKATVTVNFTVKAKPEDAPKIIKDTETPQTGDNSRVFLWLILLILSGGGLTILGIIKRHKKIR